MKIMGVIYVIPKLITQIRDKTTPKRSEGKFPGDVVDMAQFAILILLLMLKSNY